MDSNQTKVCGKGTLISEIKTIKGKDDWESCNILLRTEDANILRLQFWGVPASDLQVMIGEGSPRGVRIGFEGILRGTYDEKPSVALSLYDIRKE